MINFRYHVVSITSVFLALAIGLVLGTAALNGPVVDNLNDRVDSLSNSKDQLRDQVEELEAAESNHGDFVKQLAPAIVGGKLKDKSVVIVTAFGADSKAREGVVAMLRTSGAKVTGSLRLSDRYLDPASDASLHDLASRRVPAGVDLPDSGEGARTASALLAAVLTNGNVSADDRTTTLQAFTELGVLTPEGRIDGAANAVVFLFGNAPTGRDAQAKTKTAVTTVSAFGGMNGNIVAAAPSAGGKSNPIAGLRDNDDTKKKISTVDGASRSEGQLAVALALVQKFQGGVGHYGTGNGASAQVPKL